MLTIDNKTLQYFFKYFFQSQKMKQISMIGLRWWISYILLKWSVIEKSKYTKISSVSFIEEKKQKQNKTLQVLWPILCCYLINAKLFRKVKYLLKKNYN